MVTLSSVIYLWTCQVCVLAFKFTKIPNIRSLGSRDPDPVRVFVEREPGVRENEPVMRWVS